MNFSKPGPGVNPDEPRKKGAARLWEVLSREFSGFWAAGLLATVCFVPAAVCIYLAVATRALVFVLVGGVLGALGGPCLAGLYDTAMRGLRDEPGYWWHRYRKAVRRNAKASLVPAAVTTLLVGLEIFSAGLLLGSEALSPFMLLCILLSSVVLLAVSNLYWCQLVLMEMPGLAMLRNSVLLFFAKLPRALGAALWLLAYWFAAWLFVPLSLVVYLLTSAWLPALLAALTVYAPLNETFKIEETLAQRRKDEDAAAKRAAAEENAALTARLNGGE